MDCTTKFTPGPWLAKYVGSERCTLIGTADGETAFAIMKSWDGTPTEDEQHANARLITAAPELYEVADEADQLFRDLTGKVDEAFLDRFAAFTFKARSAAAKARGER